VIFVLATTELEKLPDTVVSRCQTFTFKKPSQAVLKDMVATIAKKEKFTLDASAAELIAILGDGSFRDTLGMLQKVINASGDNKITAEEVEAITGAPQRSLINSTIEAIATSNVEGGLEQLQKAAENNVNMKLFLKLLLAKLRLVLLVRYAKDMQKDIENQLDEEDFEFVKKMSTEKVLTSTTLAELLTAYADIENTPIPQLPIELALIRLGEGTE
jgi:DNA polymerase-3 subunit gamma/tau